MSRTDITTYGQKSLYSLMGRDKQVQEMAQGRYTTAESMKKYLDKILIFTDEQWQYFKGKLQL